jgi:glycosyltransferase involved in cell wall biosynthesis
MAKEDRQVVPAPQFSIIIAVYNDWMPLNECLRSLADLHSATSFEVIVVDDGSNHGVPEVIAQWGEKFPLSIVSQPHRGISAARNRGVQPSKGSILVFTDADCRFDPDCLTNLARAAETSPHDSFQLYLTGNRESVVGRAEELRLMTFQERILQTDGRVQYLNTAGFAIRRSQVDVAKGLFDPSVPRGEDTLLLAEFMRSGKLPYFVTKARVQHAIPLSLSECLIKDVRSAYLERAVYERITKQKVRVRLSYGERIKMLREMWQASKSPEIGRAAWFLLVGRQGLQRVVSFLCWCFRLQPGVPPEQSQESRPRS